MSAFTPQQRTELGRLLGQLSLLVRSAGTTRQARTAAIAEVSTALDEQVRDLRVANATGQLTSRWIAGATAYGPTFAQQPPPGPRAYRRTGPGHWTSKR